MAETQHTPTAIEIQIVHSDCSLVENNLVRFKRTRDSNDERAVMECECCGTQIRVCIVPIDVPEKPPSKLHIVGMN